MPYGLTPVDFVDRQHGWAVDQTGRLEISTDSGKTWTPISAQINLDWF